MPINKQHGSWLLIISTLIIAALIPISVGKAQNPIDGPPKVYIPVVFKDYDPSWQWEKLQEVALVPNPYSTMSAIDVNGKLHIFWDVWSGSQTFIYHRYQTASGWSDAEAIAPTLGHSDLLVQPVAGPDGSIHILWKNSLNSGGPYRLMYAVWKNGSWSPEAELNWVHFDLVGHHQNCVLRAFYTG